MATSSKESRALGYQSAHAHKAQITRDLETETNNYSGANPHIQDTPPPYSQPRIKDHNMANDDLEMGNRRPTQPQPSTTITTQVPCIQCIGYSSECNGCSIYTGRSFYAVLALIVVLGAVVAVSVYFGGKYTFPCLLYLLISFSSEENLGSPRPLLLPIIDCYAHDSGTFNPRQGHFLKQ